jgi:hypothetical protein
MITYERGSFLLATTPGTWTRNDRACWGDGMENYSYTWEEAIGKQAYSGSNISPKIKNTDSPVHMRLISINGYHPCVSNGNFVGRRSGARCRPFDIFYMGTSLRSIIKSVVATLITV